VNDPSHPLEVFLNSLREALEPYLGKTAYGHLREEVSEWSSDGTHSTNIALVYETPGGSTDQINVAFDHNSGLFYVTGEEGDHCVSNAEEAQRLVLSRVEAIPAKRAERLRRCVEEWLEQGRSRGQMFAEANRPLQLGFSGGSITHEELKAVIRYIVESHQRRGSGVGSESQ